MRDARELRRLLNDGPWLVERLGLLEGSKREGRDCIKIVCPWHADRRPSCAVTLRSDGTISVWCFACQHSGTALDLIAAAHGLDCDRKEDFVRVKEEAERLLGGVPGSAPPARRPAPAVKKRPPAEEVAKAWAGSFAASKEPDLLQVRGLDAAEVQAAELARLLPRTARLPRWARCQGQGWAARHRVLVPLYGASGAMESLHARDLQPGAADPKALSPTGCLLAGLVMANARGQELLRTGAAPGAGVLVAEGVPDFLTLALLEPERAVLGLVGWSWSDDVAARIPDGAPVTIWTHTDAEQVGPDGRPRGEAGQKYAQKLVRSLRGRCPVRWVHMDVPEGAKKAPDANDLLQRGGAGAVRTQLAAAQPWAEGAAGPFDDGPPEDDEIPLEVLEAAQPPRAPRGAPPDDDPAPALPEPPPFEVAPEDACPAGPDLDAQPLLGFACTDLGNAERLVHRHGADLRFCHPWGRWYIWDGARFRLDESGEIGRRAAETVRHIYHEAAEAPSDEGRDALSKWAFKSESADKLGAMAKLARERPGIPIMPGDLDADEFLLNVENGTVDLRTGELLPHRRSDLITRMAPVRYNPDAAAPTWYKFLQDIMCGNQDLVAFLCQAAGYSLTGSVREHVFFVLHGDKGRNGKGTFLLTLRELLGPYACTIDKSVLIDRGKTEHPTALTTLHKARLAIASETEKGDKMGEAQVKALTSDDPISARRMREDFWEFAPSHKLWLMTNHKPRIRDGGDPAVWARVVLIPFERHFKPEERDKELRSKLLAEREGILAWAVAGCRSWLRSGLQRPKEVLAAVESYKAESDPLKDFLEDCCVQGPDLWVSSGALYTAYTTWCQDNARDPVSKIGFGRMLPDHGFADGKSSAGVRGWKGIGLKTSRMPAADDLPRGSNRSFNYDN